MALFEITPTNFRPLSPSSLADLKLRERGDLQRLLRTQIDVLDENLYVLAEEFGDWEDSKRRIDLLAVDREANLVVIELKRTVDGGHMELQALRYAAMISTMTFEKAVSIHEQFLPTVGAPANEAKARLLRFLGWEEADEEEFAKDVRILLVSEDFGKELTTTALWLRGRGLDIRCVRLRPYSDGNARLVDVQQIIPPPEASEYQVQLREKEEKGRVKRAERYDERQRFWDALIALARTRHTRHANIKPGPWSWLGASSGVRGLGFNYVVKQEFSLVELYIDRRDEGENEQIFNKLKSQQESIEKTFGEALVWEPLETKRACRIKHVVNLGGYRSPESTWPNIHTAMVDQMTKLEAAFKRPIDALGL